MSAPSAYSLARYGWMVDRPIRMDAYVEALRRAVAPGDTVFDIGAGPGVFAILACRFGAAEAYAIETDDSVLLAPGLAKDEGVGDRVKVFHGLSTDFHPPRKADVIIADLRGNIPLFEQIIPSLIDARERLLRPGGKLIAARDRLWAALVSSPAAYRQVDEPWSRNRFGLKLESLRPVIANRERAWRFNGRNLISRPQMIQDIDYRTIDSADFAMPFELTASRSATCHGLALWYDTELYDGIGYSTGPESPKTIYGHVFLAFERPVALAEGDTASGEIFARLVHGTYHWSWRSSFERKGKPPIEFRQSSGLAHLGAADLAARSGKP